jgi:hypothetical protein
MAGLALACAVGLSACADEPAPSSPPGLDLDCDVHATAGEARFVDRTSAWGLDALEGASLSAADLNGDGYPDLVAHSHTPNTRGAVDGHHPYSVLMNEAAPEGGRRFVDRTIESGFGATPDGEAGALRSATAAIFGDVDGDGDLDAFSLTWSGAATSSPPSLADQDRSQILLNDGTGHFVLHAGAGVSSTEPRSSCSASFTDYDRDGRLDLFVGSWYSPSGSGTRQQLFHGLGGGWFDNVSADVGLNDARLVRAAFAVNACDLDDDGAPELLVSAYGRNPNMLLTMGADGVFTDRALEAGYAYDDNQSYFDDQLFACYCEDNPEELGCDEAVEPLIDCAAADANGMRWRPGSSDQPENLGGNTFTTVCSDITGDGRLDLYNSEIQHWWAGQSSDPSALLVHAAEASTLAFERPSRDETGMHWEHEGIDWDEGGLYATAGDVDNDGREDVVIGRTDYNDQWGMLFHQTADGRFEEVAKAWGYDHACPTSPLLVDFDRDGDLDLVVGTSRMREWCAAQHDSAVMRFFENDASQHGSWLVVRLEGDGVQANKSAIGARVTVDAGGTLITKELGGGYGHGTMQSDTALFFGLGGCSAVRRIDVRWPDAAATRQTFENVASGRVIELRQGDPAVHDVVPR